MRMGHRLAAKPPISRPAQEHVHDSIEDARIALLLHNKYLELKAAGKFEEALRDIYQAGHQCQWKVVYD
jgi:hypothetical protein